MRTIGVSSIIIWSLLNNFNVFDFMTINIIRGFKLEVQQPVVAWCSVIPPRRIPHAGF